MVPFILKALVKLLTNDILPFSVWVSFSKRDEFSHLIVKIVKDASKNWGFKICTLLLGRASEVAPVSPILNVEPETALGFATAVHWDPTVAVVCLKYPGKGEYG